MIIHGIAIHQITVEIKLLQVPLRLSIMNQSPYHNKAVKGPKIQNVKLFIKHENRPSNGERITMNDYLKNDNHWSSGSWLEGGTLSMWRDYLFI